MMPSFSPVLKNWLLRLVPFLAVVMIGGGVISLLTVMKPKIEDAEKEIKPRIVRAVEAIPSTRQIVVTSQGTVAPRVAISLQSEVSGRIVEVSDSFVAGGFFQEGDVILRINPRDYELDVIKAEARVAEAAQNLARQRAEAEQAAKEWAELGTGEANDLVLRKPQMLEAEARLKSARADLSEAHLSLERTELKAPFTGRVVRKYVDLGQIISTDLKAADIYSTQSLEVRLPLTDAQVALLDLPFTANPDRADMPFVQLQATFAGQERSWTARIVRTEGMIDAKSRVVYAVAGVDPAPMEKTDDYLPLTVGMFVEARIEGRYFDQVVGIPREAVRQNGTVLVVGIDNRLHFRDVEVLQSTRDTAFVRLDIMEGERVCTSPLDTPTENMEVSVAGDESVSESSLVREVSQ